MIETRGMTKNFGGLRAVSDLNLKVDEGEIVGLIGPNGAGKTTIFNLLSGFLRPTSGQILFEGNDITRQPAYRRVKLGMARTFQLIRVFRDFTISRNMIAASHLHPKIGFFEAVFDLPGYHRKERQMTEENTRILQFLGLENEKDQVARNLSHGYQQLLGIALALATHPKLLLLDEPLAGMSPGEIDRTLAIIRQIRERGTTILLIEHNMAAVMDICDRLVVLNFGQEIANGSPDEVSRNHDVIQAYLGVGEDVA